MLNEKLGIIDANADNNQLVIANAGLLIGDGASGLAISNTTVRNQTGGIIEAGGFSRVDLVNSTIIGGTLKADTGGTIYARGATLDGNTAAITIAGTPRSADHRKHGCERHDR